MGAIIFNGLREVFSAFSASSEALSTETEEALQTARSLAAQSETLGFRKQSPAAERLLKVPRLQKALAEHGHPLPENEVARIAQRIQAEDTTRRFWVQAIISLIVVVFVVLTLWKGQQTDQVQKALCGFLGTVLGYWLR